MGKRRALLDPSRHGGTEVGMRDHTDAGRGGDGDLGGREQHFFWWIYLYDLRNEPGRENTWFRLSFVCQTLDFAAIDAYSCLRPSFLRFVVPHATKQTGSCWRGDARSSLLR